MKAISVPSSSASRDTLLLLALVLLFILKAADGISIADADALAMVRAEHPQDAPAATHVWVHRIDDEGESTAWPAKAILRTGSRDYPLAFDQHGTAEGTAGSPGSVIEITAPPGERRGDV